LTVLSFPRHGLTERTRDRELLIFLHHSAEGATAQSKDIGDGRSVYAFLRPDFSSDLKGKPKVCKGNHGDNTANEAISNPRSFSLFALIPTRDDVSEQTGAYIIEATTKAMCPFTHFLESLGECVKIEERNPPEVTKPGSTPNDQEILCHLS